MKSVRASENCMMLGMPGLLYRRKRRVIEGALHTSSEELDISDLLEEHYVGSETSGEEVWQVAGRLLNMEVHRLIKRQQRQRNVNTGFYEVSHPNQVGDSINCYW